MKHICCYSGGHSSALVAIEVSRRYGMENTVLVNHDIHPSVEDADIKRFKREVSEYLGIPITYASYKDAAFDQFDVCVEAGAFKVDSGSELCTSRLKTTPFQKFLADSVPEKDCIIYYGFDPNEKVRIQRRAGILGAQGFKADFPLLWPHRTIMQTEDVGIKRPSTYSVFKHGNCVGCLKAGWQHWYVVYRTRPDIWAKAKWAEEEIGYAIHHDGPTPVYLEDMEDRFAKMKAAGVVATERTQQQTFWAQARKIVKIHEAFEAETALPCDCAHGD